MKKIILPFILLAVISGSCSNPDTATLSEAQKQAIIAELEAVDAEIDVRLNNRDAAGAFANFSEDNFLRFIDNGHLMTDLKSTVAEFAERFSRFESVKLEFTDRQYSILSPTLVLSTSSFLEEVVTINGDTINFNGAMTILSQKADDSWEVLHVHQSYFPVNK